MNEKKLMTLLMGAGCLAIILGVLLLVLGGMGHSDVEVSYLGWSVLGQAWFIMILLGFGLIALDAYINFAR